MPSLKFNTRIYKKEAIEDTIAAYSHLANFKANYSKDYVEVRIYKVDPALRKVITGEFANHALYLTKQCL